MGTHITRIKVGGTLSGVRAKATLGKVEEEVTELRESRLCPVRSWVCQS